MGGGGGSGEKERVTQRHALLRRIRDLRAELARVRAAREMQRRGRRDAGGRVPSPGCVCVWVGGGEVLDAGYGGGTRGLAGPRSAWCLPIA